MSKNYNEKDFILLTENTYADGALKTIFAPVGASMKKFGTVLKDSAKLIGTDINALLVLTFGGLKSPRERKRFMKQWKGDRKKYIDSVNSNSNALMESWPGGKVTSMMIAPGLFFTSTALNGVGTVTSENFRSEIGKMGFAEVPFFGRFFAKKELEGPEFWRKLKQDMETDGDWAEAGENIDKRIQGWLKAGNKEENETWFEKINHIFLWAHHEPKGSMLAEGDEGDDQEIELLKKKFEEFAIRQIEEDWPIDRKEMLAKRQKHFDEITNNAEKVISLNSTLAATQDHKEFFKTLKSMGKMMGEESELDVGKIESEFQNMGKKIKDDEASMKELKKEFEEAKEEPTEKAIQDKISVIVINQIKGQFLPKMKESLIDYYDDVYDMISEGLEKSQMKIISKDPYGKALVDQISEHKKKLDTALTKLGGS